VIPHSELTLGNIKDAFEHQTRAHCKAYAPQVVQLCKDIKTAAKLQGTAGRGRPSPEKAPGLSWHCALQITGGSGMLRIP
jgi:hypothetical protein